MQKLGLDSNYIGNLEVSLVQIPIFACLPVACQNELEHARIDAR